MARQRDKNQRRQFTEITKNPLRLPQFHTPIVTVERPASPVPQYIGSPQSSSRMQTGSHFASGQRTQKTDASNEEPEGVKGILGPDPVS